MIQQHHPKSPHELSEQSRGRNMKARLLKPVVWAAAGLSCAVAIAQSEPVSEPAVTAPVELEPVTAPTLSPLDVHPRTSLTVVEQLRHNHFVKKSIDDGISSDVFDKYLENLDGTRAYFLDADITEFEKYRYTLDDALIRGNLVPAYEIFNRFQMRAVDRLQYLIREVS